MGVERHRRLLETRESTAIGAGTFRREPILRACCCRLADTEIAMADDKTKRVPQDAKLISLKEDYEVEYWTQIRRHHGAPAGSGPEGRQLGRARRRRAEAALMGG
jgi:hypothetical protein